MARLVVKQWRISPSVQISGFLISFTFVLIYKAHNSNLGFAAINPAYYQGDFNSVYSEFIMKIYRTVVSGERENLGLIVGNW